MVSILMGNSLVRQGVKMYYNGSRVFVISFFVSLFTAIVVSVLMFLFLPKIIGSGQVVVPNLIGTTRDEARFLCESRDLFFVVSGEEESSEVEEGRIARQSPFPGSVVRAKTTISSVISRGGKMVTVPNLRGRSLVDATAKLSDVDLKISEVHQIVDDEVAADHIVRTVPTSGTRVKRKSEVILFVSKGKKEVTVPRVIGRSLSRARMMIENAGLVVGNVRYEVSTEFNIGIIMSQSPRAGQKVRKGSRVDLVVATVLE